ncbi:chemotaxis protein CheB [Pelodictyon phaeoclathratiforme]|jgi:two-component system CheB/CheR fusion protein|uniref:protein-glutamate O-methyltransferase n=1 Tax=Pelodictyon phaeoclathratiforme (strain DSM 5477 / BU-1) TaxID=324925 RepID=B4SAU4_PELPB|nr:chemotaxis protein CheB [Pelodictyon phaeoclathratiforme]ACF43890.1 MCP methyltransferase/methylesterase, CheR/CheB with PAS/PAC sensor [Pelodictyon phaeoclathratiforme BU-1]MBV5288429.1 PAS domain-containing protein [Pelodictyon phaeoclathratiforme]
MTKTPASSQKIKASEEHALKSEEKIPFPVVGIGSSAGGLEALELFLKHVPYPCGMAFVIIQHLDPTHKGIMVELLQRETAMPVCQVSDNLEIEPDHVYLIPPNQDMSILHGKLFLLDMVKPRGLRLPIDFFFRSMADDLKQHSIGVILSGMGSDGTLGLRAIKEKGGGVFVQDPASAKFDGMPRSAIDEGLADVIVPAENLPSKIIAYVKHLPVILKPALTIEEQALSSLKKIIILFRTQTGHDFSLYKKNTIYRRIERRMGIHEIEKISTYVHFLQTNPQEIELLFKELLIGVTSFFRDPDAWEILKKDGIPSILASRPSGGIIRAWVAGCSTGEEAYSLAIVFREVLATTKHPGNFKLQIFATDLDKNAIEKARTGIYPSNITADVSAERISQYFEKDDRGYRITRAIRETIVFAPHNVIMDPPFSKVDILVCRNLLIYMEQELQKKLIPLFHYSLNPGGILFLGSAETIGYCGQLFQTLDSKARLFRHMHQAERAEYVDFPASFTHPLHDSSTLPVTQGKPMTSDLNLSTICDKLLLQYYTPAAVLTNEHGDILYISGRTGNYLEPAAGKANLNIFAMAREGIGYELNILIRNVLREKGEISKTGVAVGTNGGTKIIDLTVRLIEKPDSPKNMLMIVFTEVAKKTAENLDQNPVADFNDRRLASLAEELKQAKEEIITIREEMQTSEEELKSTNEEMQSANEEMQSTNEELTTSKEEMQSLNEELQTVNHELQSKVTDLSQANNDMKNLLNSTDIATLFLDDELNIRRFTNRTSSIIKLIASDVGRPITDIVTELQYPALLEDAREVLHTLVFSEKQVSASNNRWFSVKIMPYRTQENRINGLVITFTDITVAKKLETSLREIEKSFRFVIDTMPVAIIVHQAEGCITMTNQEAERITGISMKEMLGKNIADLGWKLLKADGSELPPEENPVVDALRSGKTINGVVIGIIHAQDRKTRWIKISNSNRLQDEEDKNSHLFTTFFEINNPNS